MILSITSQSVTIDNNVQLGLSQTQTIRTLNNILDDGNGNVVIKGTITAAGFNAGLSRFSEPLTEQTRENSPYDINCSLIGKCIPDQIILYYIFPRSVTFPTNLINSLGIARTTATNPTSFTITVDGTFIGTINFSPYTSIPTFSVENTFTVTRGQVLMIQGPTIPDPTLADISITLVGSIT